MFVSIRFNNNQNNQQLKRQKFSVFMSIFEVCKCQCIYLVNKTACVFSLMRNDPRTTIICEYMKASSKHFYFDDPRRWQRIAIRIIFQPNIYWTDRFQRYLDEILSRSSDHCFVSGIHRILRCFSRRSSPVYLPRDREFPSQREPSLGIYICFIIDSQWQRSMFSQCLQFFRQTYFPSCKFLLLTFFYLHFYLVRSNSWTLGSKGVLQFIYYTYFCILM